VLVAFEFLVQGVVDGVEEGDRRGLGVGGRGLYG
jgi:hypothetical protein